jgi:predicted DNA-binding WGR domain protein
MENLLELSLEAHNPQANHHRRYEICVGSDLFGESTVTFRYGRTGRGGQEMRHGSADPAFLRSLIRKHLRRRLSAPRRIGCRYELTRLSTADMAIVDDWLPADLLREFKTLAVAA